MELNVSGKKVKFDVTGKLQRGVSSEEDTILLCVEDSGIGMNAEEVKRLQAEIAKPCKETEKGFGLANVNERIRMNFGMEYGMTIESEKGVGTKVSIVIPAVRLNEPPLSELSQENMIGSDKT